MSKEFVKIYIFSFHKYIHNLLTVAHTIRLIYYVFKLITCKYIFNKFNRIVVVIIKIVFSINSFFIYKYVFII